VEKLGAWTKSEGAEVHAPA